ncbi:DUF2007 domain-containing protein [Oleiagrimonas soli]|uniref:DUF2007 domain-containing protein n=1 Tax=Oleiagrimonas soli TaxID=1543381 RepID=A0A099CST1_9GAMM|nr:DUF2007 domain-containing protein [Oleiagrimonas soli]KGI77003.1 hypothetical protein LF63_0112075 [Oleiagrimonas soli]MBB6185487.1 hypothetical protein [Oleiagrimonas soli]
MRTVYHAESTIDAHLVKDALEHEEIPAFVAGEHLIGGVGQLPARDFISVAVPDSCVERAAPIVKRVETQLSEARQSAAEDPDWGDQSLPAAT